MNKTKKTDGKPPRQPLPTSPCSVVWYDGHPWVLDGEPGIGWTLFCVLWRAYKIDPAKLLADHGFVRIAMPDATKNDLDWTDDADDPTTPARSIGEAMTSAGSCMAFHSRDWSVDRRDAWLWGIIKGWDNASLDELREKFSWSPADVGRLRALRASVLAAERVETGSRDAEHVANEQMLDWLTLKLEEGCVLHPRRWSGDTHADLGGSVDEMATDELLADAAREISRLRALLRWQT